MPDLAELTRDAASYVNQHAEALRDGSHERRVLACWGLVARGSDALAWVAEGVRSDVPELSSDAAGVLRWVGVPAGWETWLRDLADRLPDSEQADALLETLESALGPEPSSPTPSAAGMLLGGSRLPFTEPIWFVESDIDAVMEALREWWGELLNEGHRPSEPVTVPLAEPLPVMLDRLEPWSMPSHKELVVPTNSGWTALFSQGSEYSTESVLGRRLGCRSMRTHRSPQLVRGRQTVSYGDCALWLSAGGKSLRTIQASFQSRWTWQLDGEAQPFEDLAAYDARRIPDRFDLARLNAYCAALGVERAEEQFYRPIGVLVEHDTSHWRQQARTMSGAEWRAEHTWRVPISVGLAGLSCGGQ